MTMLSSLKRQLGRLASISSTQMGDIIIFTTIAGWMASSAAQIYGIAVNKNYSHEQKKYMINQEVFDALTNIALYAGITMPLKALAATMVKTGKLAPRSVINFLNRAGALSGRGKIGFDVTQVKGFDQVPGLSSTYNAFKCFAEAGAATAGGIISSNIITPIVRNHIAAYRQNKYKQEKNAKLSITDIPNVNTTRNATTKQPVINTPSHRYEDYRRHVLSI